MPKPIIEQPSEAHNRARHNPAFVVYLRAEAAFGGLALIQGQLWHGEDLPPRALDILHVVSGLTITRQRWSFPISLTNRRIAVAAMWAIVGVTDWNQSARAILDDATDIGTRMHDSLLPLKHMEAK